jgi:hypothetical protein
MKKMFAAAAFLFASQLAFAAAPAAAGDCEAKAVSKDGKPLAGAAKSAFMKKCTGQGQANQPAAQSECESKAVDKNGKPLHGAAKSAFMKKCTKDAQAAK